MTKLLAAMTLVFATGCLYVSADVASIEQKLDEQQFSGAGDAHAGTHVTETKTINLNVGKDLTSLVSEAQLLKMTFTPMSGVSKMDFVNSLTVTAKGDGTLPDKKVATFEKKMGMGANGSISAKTSKEFDLSPYMKKNLPFELSVDLNSPAQDWSLAIDIELHAAAVEDLRP